MYSPPPPLISLLLLLFHLEGTFFFEELSFWSTYPFRDGNTDTGICHVSPFYCHISSKGIKIHYSWWKLVFLSWVRQLKFTREKQHAGLAYFITDWGCQGIKEETRPSITDHNFFFPNLDCLCTKCTMWRPLYESNTNQQWCVMSGRGGGGR